MSIISFIEHISESIVRLSEIISVYSRVKKERIGSVYAWIKKVGIDPIYTWVKNLEIGKGLYSSQNGKHSSDLYLSQKDIPESACIYTKYFCWCSIIPLQEIQQVYPKRLISITDNLLENCISVLRKQQKEITFFIEFQRTLPSFADLTRGNTSFKMLTWNIAIIIFWIVFHTLLFRFLKHVA